MAIAAAISTIIEDEVSKAKMDNQADYQGMSAPEIAAIKESMEATQARIAELEEIRQTMYNKILHFCDMLVSRHRKIPDDVLDKYKKFFGIEEAISQQ